MSEAGDAKPQPLSPEKRADELFATIDSEFQPGSPTPAGAQQEAVPSDEDSPASYIGDEPPEKRPWPYGPVGRPAEDEEDTDQVQTVSADPPTGRRKGGHVNTVVTNSGDALNYAKTRGRKVRHAEAPPSASSGPGYDTDERAEPLTAFPSPPIADKPSPPAAPEPATPETTDGDGIRERAKRLSRRAGDAGIWVGHHLNRGRELAQGGAYKTADKLRRELKTAEGKRKALLYAALGIATVGTAVLAYRLGQEIGNDGSPTLPEPSTLPTDDLPVTEPPAPTPQPSVAPEPTEIPEPTPSPEATEPTVEQEPEPTPEPTPDTGDDTGQPEVTENITDDQRTIERGMASSEKFEQLGIAPEDYHDFLDTEIEVDGEKLTIGEQLQKDDVLYWEPDARGGQGEWRLNYNGGELSDEKIQWIREQAEAQGYLEGAEAATETPEIPATEYFETAELGEFDDTLDPTTHYMNGTIYKAVARELNEQAIAHGFGELNFAQLQQQPGFNSAYNELVGDVLAYNDLNWDSAKNLQSGTTLKIPSSALEEFLSNVTESNANENVQTTPTKYKIDIAPETSTTEVMPLPDHYEVRQADDYRAIFQRIAENDPGVPEEIQNTEVQTQFLQDLLADRNKIAQLYRGVETDTMGVSWNSFLAESIFVPQVERDGHWYIDPVFIANATALMRKFANPESEEEAAEILV